MEVDLRVTSRRRDGQRWPERLLLDRALRLLWLLPLSMVGLFTLVSLAPAFSNLKNPILRRTVARVANSSASKRACSDCHQPAS